MARIHAGRSPGSGVAFCVLTLVLGLAGSCGEGEQERGPVGVSGSGAEGGTGGSDSGGGDSALDGAADGGPGGDCTSDPADDVCTACLKANCCTEWQVCRAEQACAICTDCLAEEQDLGSCNFTSGTCAFMSAADPTAQVLSCGLGPCEIECGFS